VDSGDTAWILTATALVLFMTLPGLALFYGGLVRQKNLLSVMMHCVAIACVSSLAWLAVAYSLVFDGTGPWIGGLSKAFLLGTERGDLTGRLPESAFFMFQMTFAIITPALIIGAFVERVKFGAVLLFSLLWLLLVYVPVAHWIWGGGWLAKLGVMDFAGGIVVHATAGVSALMFAKAVGPRDGFPKHLDPPHSPALTMMGAGMLWVGWYGFNGGSALAANGDAAMAITVTHISACAAGLTWAAFEWIKFGRPSLMGAVTGVVAGLATVTPASGFIGPLGGMALGVAGGALCFACVEPVKHRLKIDDSLDVFAVHGVGGILGALLVSVFAAVNLGGVGYPVTGGALAQFKVQALGLGAAVVWTAIATAVILFVCAKLIGLRAGDMDIEDGLDLSTHGERATPT
jgi:Amt family ammonium transporter